MAEQRTQVAYQVNVSARCIERVTSVQMKDTGGVWRTVQEFVEAVAYETEDAALAADEAAYAAQAEDVADRRTDLGGRKVELEALP